MTRDDDDSYVWMFVLAWGFVALLVIGFWATVLWLAARLVAWVVAQ